MSTESMHGYDKDRLLRRYEKANEILKEFYTLRLEYYVKRKDYLVGMLTAEAPRLSNQAKFITAIRESTLTPQEICESCGVDPVKEWECKVYAKQTIEPDMGNNDDNDDMMAGPSSNKNSKKSADPVKIFQNSIDVKKYDYLLSMSMWVLTEKRKEEFLKQRDNKLSQLAIFEDKTPKSIWLDDLEALEKKLEALEKKERHEELPYPSADGECVPFDCTFDIQQKCKKVAKAGLRANNKKRIAEDGAVNEKVNDLHHLVSVHKASVF